MADLLIVDGHALAFRAFFGYPPVHFSPSGDPVNAVQGFGAMLLNTIRNFDPDTVSVVFDAPGKCFRSTLFPEYKAQRPKTPNELVCQFPLIQEFLTFIGLPVLMVDSVEGDDVVATIAVDRSMAGDSVRILSPDKDLCQLLTCSDISLVRYDSRSGCYREISGDSFEVEFGFGPEYFVDYLALIGDRADNVPGVRGIGPKTAASLIGDFGYLENIYGNLGTLKPQVRKKLENNRDIAFLSRELVTLISDVEIPQRSFGSCCIDPDGLFHFCSSNGLGMLYSRCMG